MKSFDLWKKESAKRRFFFRRVVRSNPLKTIKNEIKTVCFVRLSLSLTKKKDEKKDDQNKKKKQKKRRGAFRPHTKITENHHRFVLTPSAKARRGKWSSIGETEERERERDRQTHTERTINKKR